MSSRKVRLTGCARFFIIMIVLAPLAFIGASYYNGEDGIENFLKLLRGDFSFLKKEVQEDMPAVQPEEVTKPQEEVAKELQPPTEPQNETPSKVDTQSQAAKLTDELNFKNQRLDSLYKENASLKLQLEEKDKALREAKDQLEKIKSAIGQ
jgi:small-conductance mechanosensitive channel